MAGNREKPRTPPKWVWVSRRQWHSVDTWNKYEIHEANDKPPKGSGWDEIHKNKYIATFADLAGFELLTGIVLKCGECVRMKWRSPVTQG